MKRVLFTLILVICFSCASIYDSEVTAPPNTMVVSLQVPTWVVVQSYGFNIDPRIDDWSKLNPGHFVLTDLKEAEYYTQVKSKVTGKVYTCYLKKGDIIKDPSL